MAYAYIAEVDNGASATGTSLTVSATYTAGDRVIVKTTRSTPGTTETITDGTNTYNLVGGITLGVGDRQNVYECLSAAAGTFTVAQTLGTTSTFRGIQVARYSGLSTSVASQIVSAYQAGPGTVADAVSSGNITPASQPGAVIGWSYNVDGGGLAAGTGYASRATFPTEAAANGSSSRLEDKRVTATTATPATFTLSVATNNVATFALFIPEPAGATVALTGVKETGAVGTVTPSVAKAITGVAGTGAPGTVGVNVTVALTGVVATGSVGTVTATQANQANLTGVATTNTPGAVKAAIDKALTGVSFAGTPGSVVPAVSSPLTGVGGAGAVGQVGVNVTVALTGVSATGTAGTVTASSGSTAALTGVAATGQAGTLAGVNVVVQLSGVSATGSVGSVQVAGAAPPGPSNQTGSGGGGGNDRKFYANLETWIKKALKGDVEPAPASIVAGIQASSEAVAIVKRALEVAHLGLPRQGAAAQRVDALEAEVQQILDDDEDAAVATLLL